MADLARHRRTQVMLSVERIGERPKRLVLSALPDGSSWATLRVDNATHLPGAGLKRIVPESIDIPVRIIKIDPYRGAILMTEWVKVYDLADDHKEIALTQQATMHTEDYGGWHG
ncbi:MAG: hypothetical protein ACNA8P_10970 [Phycisphaerales bacterium]